MGSSARLASAQLTFLADLGATSGATDGQGLFFLGFHSRIVNRVRKVG